MNFLSYLWEAEGDALSSGGGIKVWRYSQLCSSAQTIVGAVMRLLMVSEHRCLNLGLVPGGPHSNGNRIAPWVLYPYNNSVMMLRISVKIQIKLCFQFIQMHLS